MTIQTIETEKVQVPGQPKLTRQNWRRLRRERDQAKPESEMSWKDLYQEIIRDRDEKYNRLQVSKASLEIQLSDVKVCISDTQRSIDQAASQAQEIDRELKDPNRLIYAGYADERATQYATAVERVKFLSEAKATLTRQIERLQGDARSVGTRMEFYESNQWITSAIERLRGMRQDPGMDRVTCNKIDNVIAKLDELLPKPEPLPRQPVDGMESWRKKNIIEGGQHGLIPR